MHHHATAIQNSTIKNHASIFAAAHSAIASATAPKTFPIASPFFDNLRALYVLYSLRGDNMNKEYTILFNAITDALRILTEAQQKAEELYIERPAPQIIDLETFASSDSRP